jgi:hypothetical protein
VKGPVVRTCHPVAQKRAIGTLAVFAIAVSSAAFLLWRFDPRDFRMPLCTFYATTGLYCPGCGATRATHDLLHGHLLSALRHNAFWIGILPLAIYQTVSEALRLVRGYGLKHDLVSRPGVLIALAAVGVLFGVLRNIPSYPWTLLCPP